MSKTTFSREKQDELLQAGLDATGSDGFMKDAYAIGAYRPDPTTGEPDLFAVAVFECFRGGRAELHFGMFHAEALTLELVQMVVLVAFQPRYFNLDRLICRVPIDNTRALCALLKIGFQIEYRDRASVEGGKDGIVLSLDRTTILQATAAPIPETVPEPGE